MPQRVEAPTERLAEAIEIVAANAGWSAQELALILDCCSDCLEGDRVLTEVAKYKHAKFSGWITLNLKDGNVTELRRPVQDSQPGESPAASVEYGFDLSQIISVSM